jgi:hypothetical protein
VKQNQAMTHSLNSQPTESMRTINACFAPLSFGEICYAVIATRTVLLCDSQFPADGSMMAFYVNIPLIQVPGDFLLLVPSSATCS